MTEEDSKETASAQRSALAGGVSPEALRDGATQDLVDRVWLRLDASVEPTRAVSRGSATLWVLAVGASTFGVGVVVGQGMNAATPEKDFAVQPEPHVYPTPAGLAEPLREPAHRRAAEREPQAKKSERQRGPRKVSRGPAPVATFDELLAQAELAETESQPVSLEAEEVREAPSSPPTWQRLANAGEYEAALFELSQEGGFEAQLLNASAEQLMLLADVARATGQTQRALAALRRILSEFRSEPVAPLAAFSLGNLLERNGNAEGAARAFAVYRALSPEGDFAEDALVRQMRSAVERGDRDAAEQLAAQYQASFPDGRRGDEIEGWLDELEVRDRATIADAGAPQESPEDDGEPVAESGEKDERPEDDGDVHPKRAETD